MASSPPPPRGHPRVPRLWLALIVLLLVPGAAFLLGSPLSHLGRYLAIGLAAALGLFLVLAPHRRLDRRLAGLLFGLALAGAAWWFVPAGEDGTLWAAWRPANDLVGRLEAVPLGDQGGFARDQPHRRQLMNAFPLLRWRLGRAETAWNERSQRAQALAERVDDYRRQAHALIARDQSALVGGVGERAWEKLRAEAADLGLLDSLRSFRDQCRAVGRLGKRAGESPP